MNPMVSRDYSQFKQLLPQLCYPVPSTCVKVSSYFSFSFHNNKKWKCERIIPWNNTGGQKRIKRENKLRQDVCYAYVQRRAHIVPKRSVHTSEMNTRRTMPAPHAFCQRKKTKNEAVWSGDNFFLSCVVVIVVVWAVMFAHFRAETFFSVAVVVRCCCCCGVVALLHGGTRKRKGTRTCPFHSYLPPTVQHPYLLFISHFRINFFRPHPSFH